MAAKQLIYFFTDFGASGPYLGQMEAAVLKIAPTARVTMVASENPRLLKLSFILVISRTNKKAAEAAYTLQDLNYYYSVLVFFLWQDPRTAEIYTLLRSIPSSDFHFQD